MIRNPFAFTALTGVGRIFMLLGKFGIAFSTALCGYLIITYSEHYKGKIFSPFVPTIVILYKYCFNTDIKVILHNWLFNWVFNCVSFINGSIYNIIMLLC